MLPSSENQKLSGADSIHSRSRETILYTGEQDHLSLLSIYGGKVTTYRLTAERVMARLSKILPARKIIADTRHLKL